MIFNSYSQKALLNKLAWRELFRVLTADTTGTTSYFHCGYDLRHHINVDAFSAPLSLLDYYIVFTFAYLFNQHLLCSRRNRSKNITSPYSFACSHCHLLLMWMRWFIVFCIFKKEKVEKQAYWWPKCKGWLIDCIITRHDTNAVQWVRIQYFLKALRKLNQYPGSCGLNYCFFGCRSTLIKAGMSWNSVLTGLEMESNASASASGSSMKVSHLLNVTLSTVISWWFYQSETFLIRSPYTLFFLRCVFKLFCQEKHAVMILAYNCAAQNSEIIAEFSDSFVQWVTHGETMFHWSFAQRFLFLANSISFNLPRPKDACGFNRKYITREKSAPSLKDRFFWTKHVQILYICSI